MKKEMITHILANGYTAKGAGYTKTTEAHDCKIVHWVTLFGIGKVQLYAYYEGDDDTDNYVYNTGVVTMNLAQLGVFINVLCV